MYIFFKSVVSHASPSPILSRVHSSQYHFSHSNYHAFVSLSPHSSRDLHHTTKSPSCNQLLCNLHHIAKSSSQTSITLAARPRPSRTAPEKHQLMWHCNLHPQPQSHLTENASAPRCNFAPITIFASTRPSLEFFPTPFFLFLFYLLFTELATILNSLL